MSAYLTSMYFAYSTLTTVGYGDISAHTDVERSVAILSLITGSVIYAVLVGFINNLVDNSDVKETEYQQRLTAINSFMSNHHLPNELRNRVRRYMELDHNAAHHDIKLLEYLSPMLQREAIMHMNRHFVSDVPFLQDADSIFVWCVLERMIVIVCVQKEYILVEGQVIEAMHILKSGKVDVIDRSGHIIRTYTQGSFFGESCCSDEKQYAKVSYRAKVDMEICLISQDDLHTLLEAFAEFKETLDVIVSARELHEKRESTAIQDRMDKMMKQTGMKARAVTPPHGKEWEGTVSPHGLLNRQHTSSPSKRKEFFEGLEGDIKTFKGQEERKEERDKDRMIRKSLMDIQAKEVTSESSDSLKSTGKVTAKSGAPAYKIVKSEEYEESDDQSDSEMDKEVEVITSSKNSSRSQAVLTKNKKPSEKDLALGLQGASSRARQMSQFVSGQVNRHGSHRTPPVQGRRVSVSESLQGIGGASLAQFAKAHGGHTVERVEREGIEAIVTGNDRMLEMMEGIMGRMEAMEKEIKELRKESKQSSKSPGRIESRRQSDVEVETMMKSGEV